MTARRIFLANLLAAPLTGPLSPKLASKPAHPVGSSSASVDISARLPASTASSSSIVISEGDISALGRLPLGSLPLSASRGMPYCRNLSNFSKNLPPVGTRASGAGPAPPGAGGAGGGASGAISSPGILRGLSMSSLAYARPGEVPGVNQASPFSSMSSAARAGASNVVRRALKGWSSRGGLPSGVLTRSKGSLSRRGFSELLPLWSRWVLSALRNRWRGLSKLPGLWSRGLSVLRGESRRGLARSPAAYGRIGEEAGAVEVGALGPGFSGLWISSAARERAGETPPQVPATAEPSRCERASRDSAALEFVRGMFEPPGPRMPLLEPPGRVLPSGLPAAAGEEASICERALAPGLSISSVPASIVPGASSKVRARPASPPGTFAKR
mmetsp:Transcript_38129/g.120430  ORF Transcript_38129/g.120430 Transcript_38129/m.120430 type:complete len:386 (-) Transcript_38129:1647-2804(-)